MKSKRIFFIGLSILCMAWGLAGCVQNPAVAPTAVPTLAPTIDFTEKVDGYLEDGDLEKAVELLRGVLAEEPENPAANYRLGLVLSVIELEEAGEYLERAAELDNEYADPADRMLSALRQARAVNDAAYRLTLTGQALASLEEWPLAEVALRQAVEEAPNYSEAWAYLGEVFHQRGKDGYPALQTAIRLDPTSYAANVFLGLYWRRSDQPANAVPYLQTAFNADPDNLTLLQDLAYTQVQAGLVEQALETVYQALETHPDDGQTWLLLAKISIEHDIQVTETGIPAARQAVVLHPEEAEPLLILGRAYILLGNTQLAERFLSEASLADPTWADPHYYLGLLYFNLGDLEPAEAHLNEAVQLAGENENSFIQEQALQILEKFMP